MTKRPCEDENDDLFHEIKKIKFDKLQGSMYIFDDATNMHIKKLFEDFKQLLREYLDLDSMYYNLSTSQDYMLNLHQKKAEIRALGQHILSYYEPSMLDSYSITS